MPISAIGLDHQLKHTEISYDQLIHHRKVYSWFLTPITHSESKSLEFDNESQIITTDILKTSDRLLPTLDPLLKVLCHDISYNLNGSPSSF